jgi:hypothetical protein
MPDKVIQLHAAAEKPENQFGRQTPVAWPKLGREFVQQVCRMRAAFDAAENVERQFPGRGKHLDL